MQYPRKKKKYLMTILVTGILFLTGCGGGGGNVSAREDDNTNVVRKTMDDNSSTVSVVLGTSDLPSIERVVEHLRRHASGGPWQAGTEYSWSHPPGLTRFDNRPTVRLATGMSERERGISMYAIALINRAIPYDQHILLGADAPAGVAGDWEIGLPEIPDGQMFIEFIDGYPQGGRPGSAALSHASWVEEYDDQQQRWEKKGLRASSVEMNSDFFRGVPDWQAVSVLVHELVHSLGFSGHPGHDFSDSIMENAWFRIDGSLPDIDIASLQALYLKLEEATEPEELSTRSLGAWADGSSDMIGSLGPITFGVRHANDVSVPFTAGPEPSASFSQSRLSGTATWRGNLLGLTSNQQTVAGDATVSVEHATMQGTAKFSDLRSFSRRTVPMSEEGEIWGDGGLDYDLRVGSNYLHSIGGDDGVVSGAFYGNNHSHVGGTVERSDLTAAFGATR